MNTYFISCWRGFANEYDVAIATNKASRDKYNLDEKWERISRRTAERRINDNGDDATEMFIGVEINGESWDDYDEISRLWHSGSARVLIDLMKKYVK